MADAASRNRLVVASVVEETRTTESEEASSDTVMPAEAGAAAADQAELSLRVSLADLCAKAAVLYSQQKNYEEAAEVYARAAEMQAEMNGEMHPDNAEILFLYGRALFKVGQSKSDVLGGKAPEATADEGGAAKKKAKSSEPQTKGSLIADAMAAGDGTRAKEDTLQAKKPLFQFTGDEEWDDSDEDENGGGDDDEGNDEDEEEDDLAVAFEVLDLARVLFEKQLHRLDTSNGAATADESQDKGKGKEAAASTETGDGGEEEAGKADKLTPGHRHILERLADTHDLLAEISLENERYPNAIVDSRASLAYKSQYLPDESEIMAEAHFKLSLALEFASVTTSNEDGAGAAGGSGSAKDQVDQELRDEAASELEAAIASTRLKLQNKEVELATLHSPEDNEATRQQIAEVKEIVADMEQRLVDLRKPPIDINAAVHGLGGGGSSSSSGRVEKAAAAAAATDLTGLVRKRAKESRSTTTAAAANGAAKRKADEEAEDGSEEEAKKPRTGP